MVAIRRATTDDIPALIEMQREGRFHDYVGHMPDGYAAMAMQRYGTSEAIAGHLQRFRYYWVVEAEGEGQCDVAGAVTGDHTVMETAELWWIHVRKRWRERGIGRLLIEHFVSNLAPEIKMLYVTTFQIYAPAIVFYHRLGFTDDHVTVGEYDGVLVNDLRLRMTVVR